MSRARFSEEFKEEMLQFQVDYLKQYVLVVQESVLDCLTQELLRMKKKIEK